MSSCTCNFFPTGQDIEYILGGRQVSSSMETCCSCANIQAEVGEVHSLFAPTSVTDSNCVQGVDRLVHKQLLSYLSENNLVNKHQLSVLSGRSTLFELASNLQQLHTTMSDSRDTFMRAVFLDISKAFNKVWHTGLLHKLDKMGTDRPWFESYQSGRSQ